MIATTSLAEVDAAFDPAIGIHTPSADSAVLEGVPYVWQEINGFCAWAATSIVMQYEGAPLDLHDIFAVSGVGFSFAYYQRNDTLLIFPGAIYQQIDPVVFMTDLYGLNYTIYFSSEISGVDEQVAYLEGRGINVGLIDSELDAFALMRRSIDAGHPLLVSVDPAWLPASDYDYLKQQGLTGGGHGVVVVGYNESAGVAWINDPGVGSFGDSFGYPYDGRGNYSQISYTNLNLAWASRYYVTILIEPYPEGSGIGPVEDKASLIGPRTRDLLLGVGQTYAPGLASAYLLSYGEKGFRDLGADVLPDALSSYLSVFDGIESEVLFKAALLKVIGLGIEAQVTLQYLSYRAALERLPAYLPGFNLSLFLKDANEALPHFEALSDNDTLVYPGNMTLATGLSSQVFGDIADLYNSTGDMATALQTYADGLEMVSSHLTGIADSWLAAGNVLAVIWPSSPLVIYGPYLVVAAIGVAALVLIGIRAVRKTPSS